MGAREVEVEHNSKRGLEGVGGVGTELGGAGVGTTTPAAKRQTDRPDDHKSRERAELLGGGQGQVPVPGWDGWSGLGSDGVGIVLPLS